MSLTLIAQPGQAGGLATGRGPTPMMTIVLSDPIHPPGTDHGDGLGHDNNDVVRFTKQGHTAVFKGRGWGNPLHGMLNVATNLTAT